MIESAAPETILTLVNLKELNINSERTVLNACIRWAKAEVQRRSDEVNPPSLQKIFGPLKKHIRFLTMSPQEFTTLAINANILTENEALSILSELTVPNANIVPLPSHINNSTTARGLNHTKHIYVYVGMKKDDTDALIWTESIYDLISTMRICIQNHGDDIFYGVRVPGRHHANQEPAACEYIVCVKDVESGDLIQAYKRTTEDATFDIDFTINFSERPLFARRLHEYSEVEIKVIMNTSGYYPFTNGRGKVDKGQFGDLDDVHLHRPKGHNFIIAIAMNNR